MEDLIKKVSYLKGYADGLDLSPKSDEGKLIIKLLDVMSEMADTIEELTQELMMLKMLLTSLMIASLFIVATIFCVFASDIPAVPPLPYGLPGP